MAIQMKQKNPNNLHVSFVTQWVFYFGDYCQLPRLSAVADLRATLLSHYYKGNAGDEPPKSQELGYCRLDVC